mgnify:CR=1 FL=1
MRNLSEQEVEMVSGAGNGDTYGVIAASSVATGFAAFGVGLVLAGTGPIGWAVAAGVLVAGGTAAGEYAYLNSITSGSGA